MHINLNQWGAIGLSSGLSVVIFLIFKWVAKRKVLLPAVIVWNYLTCVWVGALLLWETPVFNANALKQEGYWPIVSLGVLFMITFLLMGRATAKSGAAMSAVASKMSVVIPILIAVMWFAEQMALSGYIGIALALIAVFLITYQPNTALHLDRSLLWVFLGSGLVDTGMNALKQANYVHWSNLQFAVLTFSGAAICGVLFMFLTTQIKSLWNRNTFLWGSFLGVVNLFSIFAIYHGLDAFQSKSAVFFTLNNIAVVVLTFLLGLTLGERFSKAGLVGLFLAVLAIFLLS